MSHNCRFCSTPLQHTFCDLGKTPPSNSYLKRLDHFEHFFPASCLCVPPLFSRPTRPIPKTPMKFFGDYAYFSSFSSTWVEHARLYTEQVTSRFHLNSKNLVIEVASNDGYLLQHFKAKKHSYSRNRAGKKYRSSRYRKRDPHPQPVLWP